MQYPRLARDPNAVCRRHHRTIRKLLERRPAFSARSPNHADPCTSGFVLAIL